MINEIIENNIKQPLVTIITPSFNHGRYLENTVQSVIDQTYKNIEYIIIDDGSTDNSHEVIKGLVKKFPFIQYRLYKENKGHVRMNEAIEMAKGEFISLLSSDDWYLPDKIEKQVDKFKELDDSYGVVYSAGYRHYEDTGETKEPETNKNMRRGEILYNLLTEPFFIYPITPLIRKKCLLEYPFLPNYAAEGEAIYFRIAMKYKFDFVDEPLVVMRDHTGNTGKSLYKMTEDNLGLRKFLLDHNDFPKKYKRTLTDNIANIHFYNGWQMIRNYSDHNNGLKHMKTGVKLNKKLFFNVRFILAFLIHVKSLII